MGEATPSSQSVACSAQPATLTPRSPMYRSMPAGPTKNPRRGRRGPGRGFCISGEGLCSADWQFSAPEGLFRGLGVREDQAENESLHGVQRIVALLQIVVIVLEIPG